MSNSNRLIKQLGISSLEFAASGILLFTLVFGGFSTSLLIQNWIELNYLVDKRLHDTSMHPLQLDYSSGSSGLRIDFAGLEGQIQNLLDQISADVRAGLDDPSLAEEGYFIETAYAVLEIDPQSGEFQSLSNYQARSSGSLIASLNLQRKSDLKEQFRKAAALKADSSGKASLYAVPSALFSEISVQRQFLPQTVLIGVRAFVSLQGGATGSLYSALIGEPIIYNFKVAMLRGEVKS